ncbi:MAG: KTSC domain-containing protein [Oscillospiraceae bacterium]
MICYIFALLIVLSQAGCAETKSLQESDAIPTATAGITTSPDTTSTPTPRVFDVDDVEMKSTPDSTCFSEVGYDSGWEVLVVKFRDSGSVYTYSDFPKSEWDEFIAADSLGRWYNTYIKDQYEYERIN